MNAKRSIPGKPGQKRALTREDRASPPAQPPLPAARTRKRAPDRRGVEPAVSPWTMIMPAEHWPATPPVMQTAGGILREVAEIVDGSRQQTHGEKERSFDAAAGLWNAYLAARRAPGELTGVDVAMLMCLLKTARSLQGEPVQDHYLDGAGYFAIAGELALAKAGRS